MELQESITFANVETRFRQAQRLVDERRWGTINGSLRAARERHPLLMMCLDRAAEVTSKAADDQYGRTRRSADRASTRAEPFVSQAFREAYVAADRGNPIEPLAPYYITGALLAGLVTP